MALITSVQTGGVNNHETTSEEVNALATDFASEGIVGDIANTSGVAPATGGFAVNAQGTPDATVAVSAGVAYVQGTPTSQNSQMFRVKNTATANVTISANSSGSTKYDWIYIKLDPTNLNAPNTAGDNAATLVASRSSSAISDDGTPPTYGYPIAVVTVANGFTTITDGNIADNRVETGMTPASSDTSTESWTNLASTPASVVYNGNRSYTLTHNSIDLTDTELSNGMRLRLTRTVTAPTQCTDLESGSSQYYNKTSPAGMTFTDDFVVSAWVKLESYGAFSVASRYNGTSGWDFKIDTDGTIYLAGFNAGSTNISYVRSYQSVPLNKWVHLAAQLDMSTFTATTTTSYVMIDGVDVPALVARGGTNPTALIQAGNLEIGGRNGGLQPFDGKLAQVAIYSAKVTQANVRATISQTLTGSETSLISAYSFNNSIADLNTTNANNLTAQGSAVATATDSPFANRTGLAGGVTAGTTEYAIIMANTFSTNTTLTVQVPEGCAIPTTGGVSAVSYSTQKVPYGFPGQRGKWRVVTVDRNTANQASPVSGTWYNVGNTQLNLPIGEWDLGYQVIASVVNATNAPNIYTTISTANNSESDTEFTGRIIMATPSAATTFDGTIARSKTVSATSATLYYLNAKTVTASANPITYQGAAGATVITADNAYI